MVFTNNPFPYAPLLIRPWVGSNVYSDKSLSMFQHILVTTVRNLSETIALFEICRLMVQMEFIWIQMFVMLMGSLGIAENCVKENVAFKIKRELQIMLFIMDAYLSSGGFLMMAVGF